MKFNFENDIKKDLIKALKLNNRKMLEERECIIRVLPVFVSELVLLLYCGIIFNDALEIIVSAYSDSSTKNYFEEQLCKAVEVGKETNKSSAVMLNNIARSSGIREFIRITGIILDSQCRGTDLTAKLEQEGEALWLRRKKMAEEKGKSAETKLTFPLGLLLVVLIIITAAPAILII